MAGLNLKRHVLIATGLFVAVVAGLVVWNWKTVGVMVDNATAMNEGAQAAQAIQSPDDLLAYMAEHPEHFSLVAFTAGTTGDTLRYRAHEPRPTVHTEMLPLIWTLVEARPDTVPAIPRQALDAFALPSAGGAAHRRGMEALGDSVLSPLQVATLMARYSDRAAADWWMLQHEPEALRRWTATLGLTPSATPRPYSGLFLRWRTPTTDTPAVASADALRAPSVAALLDTTFFWARRLQVDLPFRMRVRQQLKQRGSGLTVQQQRALASASFPQGRADRYARLLLRLAASTNPVAQRVRGLMETPIRGDSVQTPLTAVASLGGAFPGHITFAGYARRADALPRIVVLFASDLPMAVFYQLLQTGIDKGFLLQLMADDAFFAAVRTRLDTAVTASSGADGL
ncbi:hypothetical protein [Salisaeta longa]|uniref:hypothetical protein n=1 Tax=Salisaeta longa TaxID=503170 RepID=UPI0003B4FED5|nr:hypothetical protein [Salisaeta longa]